jgi:hypothetical protein
MTASLVIRSAFVKAEVGEGARAVDLAAGR